MEVHAPLQQGSGGEARVPGEADHRGCRHRLAHADVHAREVLEDAEDTLAVVDQPNFSRERQAEAVGRWLKDTAAQMPTAAPKQKK